MNAYKFVTVIVVSVLVAILLASALNSFTRITDSALADNTLLLQGGGRGGDGGSNTPRTTSGKNYLPIIFLNSATAGSAWLLNGNAGTVDGTDFLGTTDNVTFTVRVSNTVAYRIVPAVDTFFANGGFSPNLIGGAIGNTVAPGVFGATIGGGGNAVAPNVVASGTSYYATISGGVGNTAGDFYAAIGGGDFNTASGTAATVGGGSSNLAGGVGAAIGGGYFNTASGAGAFGGGDSNTASNQFATVGGGYINTAGGVKSTVGGGGSNTATGQYATVPGGAGNVASGDYSFAAGQNANTNNKGGAFVWADAVTTTVLNATTANQFLVRASGGITLYTNSEATIGASLYPGSGSWNNLSNKNLKANFNAVDSRAILAQVNALPITTWNYTTQDSSIRHIGPMAQDFAAAFKVGENDTTISTVDAQGMALAAIQGLAQENQDLKAQVASLQSQNALLDARVSALEQANGVPAPNALPISNDALFIGALVLGGFIFCGRRKRV